MVITIKIILLTNQIMYSFRIVKNSLPKTSEHD